MDFIDIRFLDILDIVLFSTILYSIYKLVKGTVAINIFLGIITIYGLWQLTKALDMLMLSAVLGKFIGVGVFALIVVFQQEIRKFLLLIGSTNITYRTRILQYLKLIKKRNSNFKQDTNKINIDTLLTTCRELSKTNTGALIIIKRNTSLEFVKKTGDPMYCHFNQPILESIFYKNSPLHDGAIVIEKNIITATRVILPITNRVQLPSEFGLRHRAAASITFHTDAIALVVSEENGKISCFFNGDFMPYTTFSELTKELNKTLQ